MSTFTQSQLDQLSKWANDGRLIVRPITREPIPEWAQQEFLLAKRLIRTLLEMKRLIPPEIQAETASRKTRRYQQGASKGWRTRKAQAAARKGKAA